MSQLALFPRVCALTLLLFAHLFPTFDAGTPDFLLRWDVVHFAHVARNGYVYEHEWAFFPSIHALISMFPYAPTFLAIALSVDATKTMHQLSLHHLQSPALADLATLLSLLPSSPATLFIAPYSEPFFTYFSYKGMLFCTQARYFLATICFTVAATFRANGFMLSGFIIWELVVQPALNRKISFSAISTCAILSPLPFLPFIAHNYAAYVAFCNDPTSPTWCTQRLPLIYSHVQSQYWNVGLLRYWTIQQLPNFIIAAPPLLLICTFSFKYLMGRTSLSPSILPHAIHAVVMCAIYLLASHTQIVLRQAASLPITYWAASWLLVQQPKWGRAWVTWSLLWGILSTLLWGSFLPPA